MDPTSAPEPELGTLRDATSRVRFHEMPTTLRRRLVDRFEVFAADRRPARLRDRIAALLDTGTALGPVVAGARGAGTDTGRQLLFTSDRADVALHVRDATLPGVIDGQVLPADDVADDQILVEVVLDGVVLAEATADDAGSFLVDGLAAGSYALVVCIGDDEIDVGPVEVGTRT